MSRSSQTQGNLPVEIVGLGFGNGCGRRNDEAKGWSKVKFGGVSRVKARAGSRGEQ